MSHLIKQQQKRIVDGIIRSESGGSKKELANETLAELLPSFFGHHTIIAKDGKIVKIDRIHAICEGA